MIRFDLHTHTVFSDGENTPEEMVAYAEKNGIEILGISDHEYAPMQTSYCVSLENTPKYAETINALKEKTNIKLYLGTERDYFSPKTDIKYDYVIGSVHSILKNGEYIDVDHSAKAMEDNVQRLYNGDYLEYVKDYYALVKDVVDKTKCDIVGHFDLVCKFNEGNKYFDETSEEYKKIALDAAEAIVRSGKIVEINTGAISRGYKTKPYPAQFILDYFKENNVKMILNGDSHSAETLCFKFDEFEYLLK